MSSHFTLCIYVTVCDSIYIVRPMDGSVMDKSSLVTEMGDRGHNRHGRKEGVLCPFRRGKLGLRLTQCGLGRRLLPYQVASSSILPFRHNKHGPKTGGCAPIRGSCDPI